MLNFLEADFYRAALNWVEWRDDFECAADKPLPILTDEDRFIRFSNEYNVPNKRRPTDRARRQKLFSHLNGTVNLDSNVDDMSDAWKRDEIFTLRQISLASKIMSFRNPAKYIPWDQFSRKGLREIDKGTATPATYAAYLERFNTLKANKENEEKLKAFLDGFQLPIRHHADLENRVAGFKNRVVDCALMRIGGRF
jgi:hypothetical protein